MYVLPKPFGFALMLYYLMKVYVCESVCVRGGGGREGGPFTMSVCLKKKNTYH